MKKRCYMFTFKLQLFSIGTIHLLIRVVSSYKVSIDVEEFTLWKKIEIQHQWLQKTTKWLLKHEFNLNL
jgi:hypothetical protein